MNSQQLDEEAIFHIARQLASADARATYLDQVCAGDASLRERVEALLRIHEQEQSFLSSGSPNLTPTAAAEPLAERPGTTIGRYRLMEQIGEGGMGVVFVAEQEKPIRRKVALKVIKPGMDTKEVIARFEAERQALALMDHPNIAKVLDAGGTNRVGHTSSWNWCEAFPLPTIVIETNSLFRIDSSSSSRCAKLFNMRTRKASFIVTSSRPMSW